MKGLTYVLSPAPKTRHEGKQVHERHKKVFYFENLYKYENINADSEEGLELLQYHHPVSLPIATV